MDSPLPDFIHFGRATCGDLAQAERREWWLGNGLGGYAAGTVAGSLSRRYHGLLIAPIRQPLGRMLVFAKADATLLDGERRWPLFSNRWPDAVIDPQGFFHIESFGLDGRMPVWRFAFGALRLEMRVWLEPGAHTVYVAYKPQLPLGDQRQRALTLKLLVNARDHHGLSDLEHFDPAIELDGETGLTVRNQNPAERYSLYFRVRGGTVKPAYGWYRDFDLPLERERGLPDRDHHFCAGECHLLLQDGEWSGFSASLSSRGLPYLREAMRRFKAHDKHVLARSRLSVPAMAKAPAWIEQLILAADSFLFARPLEDGKAGESVIAGYPWFGDWGRDTMIALPGLTLATGRYQSARRILETFSRFVDRGMLPNVFPGDGSTPEYNTVDAGLWFIEAWRAYLEVTRDIAALRKAFPVLVDIIRWHRRGTRYGIGLDLQDGLLRAGEPGVQLTWMDAKVGDWVVTPRIGKPVEINALWYNALCSMVEFAGLLGESAAPYQALADQSRAGFERFIAPDGGGLIDVLDSPDGDDRSLRPNQIFAVSLRYSPLTAEIQERVVRRCGRDLLTSYGLRSLDVADPRYRPHYRGDIRSRDGAYHQGPVWAWLLGHYALAEYRVYGRAEIAQARLDPVRDHLFDAGLGNVSEIFDGAPPHLPRGAPAQAWSVACVLEAWWKLELARRGAKSMLR